MTTNEFLAQLNAALSTKDPNDDMYTLFDSGVGAYGQPDGWWASFEEDLGFITIYSDLGGADLGPKRWNVPPEDTKQLVNMINDGQINTIDKLESFCDENFQIWR